MTPINNIPAALSAIAGQLDSYRAPDETVQTDGDCRLSYEILQWTKTHPDSMTDNKTIGTVEISRYNKGDETEYHIFEKRLGGGEEVYEGTVTTTKNSDFGESILSWRLDWHQAESADDLLQVSGTVHGETVRMDGMTGQKQYATNSPVLCPWIIPFALAHRVQDPQLSKAFTSMDELTYCKPNQLLYGPVHIETDGEPLLAFRHTGPATLPIHYVFDPQGRPVFVTFTMLSWILRTIDTPDRP